MGAADNWGISCCSNSNIRWQKTTSSRWPSVSLSASSVISPSFLRCSVTGRYICMHSPHTFSPAFSHTHCPLPPSSGLWTSDINRDPSGRSSPAADMPITTVSCRQSVKNAHSEQVCKHSLLLMPQCASDRLLLNIWYLHLVIITTACVLISHLKAKIFLPSVCCLCQYVVMHLMRFYETNKTGHIY